MNIFNPAPHLPEIQDQERVSREYKYWKIRILYSMFVGYALYYFTRKSFIYAMPGIVNDLGYDKAQLGLLTSIGAITYGVSKFFSGILSDQSNPRFFMAIGLIFTGIINILFGLSSSLLLFIVFWTLNGVFQGFGWPPCARFLTHWYSQSERGSWWCAFSVSHNVGGFLIPWVVGFCLYYWGWRWGMFIPGIICVMGGVFLIDRLRDTPQSIGLPPVEKYRNDYPTKDHSLDQEKELTTRDLIDLVIKNKYIWMLGIVYFFIHVVRGGVENWTALYLIQEKNYNNISANGVASLFEVGGFIGTLTAGWASDRFFQARRLPVNALLAMLCVIITFGFWWLPDYYWIKCCVLLSMGFSVFGPHLLIGLAAAELTHKKAAATATGFIGIAAYLGMAIAGYPMGKIIDVWGWEGFFMSLIVCGLVPILILFPMWHITYADCKNVPRSVRSKKPLQEQEEITYA